MQTQTKLAVGTLIDGKYEIAELAGEGGMATVYRAVVRGAAGFSRTVAVKRMRPEFRAIQNYIDMFVEEARVGSELAHPNIVQVYDFCADHRRNYHLIMEWVEGLDFGTLLRALSSARQRLAWPMAAAVGIGALRGLDAAHQRHRPDGSAAPIIHRDVSPQNILIGTNGVVKLTDFGLARARDRAKSLTTPGTVKGKLSYLAPEIAWGKNASAASDIFAMGLVLWEALIGQRAFAGSNDPEVFKKIRECNIPAVGELLPNIPPELSTLIASALSREPERRPPTARAFALALADILKHADLGGDAQGTMGALIAETRQRLGKSAATATAPSEPAASEAKTTGESVEIVLSAIDIKPSR